MSSVFDEHADQYEAWFEQHSPVYLSELDAVRTLLPATGAGIEIGVGSGLFAGPLGITQGVDPSPVMLERARSRGIITTKAVAESLPFESGLFDYVLMVTTVCFLDDIDLAFQEVFRVLRPQGSFLVGFVDKESTIGRSYQEKKDQSLFYKNAVFYSVPEILSHLTQAGFGSFQSVQTLFHPLQDIKSVEPVRYGHGQGSFVVIRAKKDVSENGNRG